MTGVVDHGIWTTEDDVSRIAEAVIRALADRVLRRLTKLGEGIAHLALETDDGLVVMVGKNYMAPHDRDVSLRLLPALDGRLPLAVPRPLWAIEHADDLPFGVYAYEKLPGTSISVERTQASVVPYAHQIGAIIAALGSFPVDKAQALGVLTPSAFGKKLILCRREIDPALRSLLTPREFAALGRWWTDFETDQVLRDSPVCLVHGDFWAANILIDTGSQRVTGVIDFANAMLGDVANDFATLRNNGYEFTNACIEGYVAAGGVLGPHLEHRVERYWQLRSSSLFSFQASLRLHDGTELAHALSDLRGGPILA